MRTERHVASKLALKNRLVSILAIFILVVSSLALSVEAASASGNSGRGSDGNSGRGNGDDRRVERVLRDDDFARIFALRNLDGRFLLDGRNFIIRDPFFFNRGFLLRQAFDFDDLDDFDDFDFDDFDFDDRR